MTHGHGILVLPRTLVAKGSLLVHPDGGRHTSPSAVAPSWRYCRTFQLPRLRSVRMMDWLGRNPPFWVVNAPCTIQKRHTQPIYYGKR